MLPGDAIEMYRIRVWDDRNSSEDPLNVVRETLLAALKQFPTNDELLLEIAIFHEVVTEEFEIALTFFDRVSNKDDYDYVYHCSRCLASKRLKNEALKIIDSSPHKNENEMLKLRAEIDDNEWGEYGEYKITNV